MGTGVTVEDTQASGLGRPAREDAGKGFGEKQALVTGWRSP